MTQKRVNSSSHNGNAIQADGGGTRTSNPNTVLEEGVHMCDSCQGGGPSIAASTVGDVDTAKDGLWKVGRLVAEAFCTDERLSVCGSPSTYSTAAAAAAAEAVDRLVVRRPRPARRPPQSSSSSSSPSPPPLLPPPAEERV
eukprot:74326-Pelagomonas_calceolata.AAC.1